MASFKNNSKIIEYLAENIKTKKINKINEERDRRSEKSYSH